MTNNFIVWDEDEREFYIVDTIIGTTNGYRVAKVKPLPENCDAECYSEFTIFDWDYSDKDKILKPIGIKDINNKTIYADSSIVECDYYEDFKDKATIRGYFKYDDKDLAYYFIFLNSNRGSELFINLDLQNIKIIDTIQDNKED